MWAPLAGSCLGLETYLRYTESTSFTCAVVSQRVFSLSLPVLLLSLPPGYPHPTFLQAAVTSGTAWWGHTCGMVKEEERKEQCQQANSGSATQGFRLCSLCLGADGLWYTSAFLMKTTLCFIKLAVTHGHLEPITALAMKLKAQKDVKYLLLVLLHILT